MKQYHTWLAVLVFVGALGLLPTSATAANTIQQSTLERNKASLSNFSFLMKKHSLNQDPQPTGTAPVEGISTVAEPLPVEQTPAVEDTPQPASEPLLQNSATGSHQMYLPVAITAKVFHVSPNGNDANPGTSDKPWRTIQKAADTLKAGETVKILPGTYNAKFTPRNSGAPNNFITYTADPGTVILDGSGVSLSTASRGDGLVQILGKSYIKIQNLTVRDSSVNCVNISDDTSGNKARYIEITGLNIQNCAQAGIRARKSDHLLIKGNTIDHITYSSGIGVWFSSNVTVDQNTITNAHYLHECQGAHEEVLTISYVDNFEVKNNSLDNTDLPPPGFCNSSEKLGIGIKESAQNGLVYRNTVKNMNAASIYFDGHHAGANGTPTLNHVNVFQNRIINSAGIVVGAEQADGVVEHINIYNNVLINARFSGIQVRKAYGDGLRKNIAIYNNTIYGALPAGGNGGAGIYVTTSNLGSNNGDAPVTIRNNISMFYFLSNGGGYIGQIVAGNATVASKIAADHNIVYGPQICSYEYPDCKEAGSRTSAGPGSVFVDPGAFDLRLKDGSPAIDAGLSISLFSSDYLGYKRPEGSSYDIGAYEAR